MSLISAKPTLQTQLRSILYNAAYKAMKETQTSGTDVASNIKSQIDAEFEKFSVKFANRFADEAYIDMASAIYDFVMSISINMTPSGTLIAPTMGGPVTGTAIEQNFIVY